MLLSDISESVSSILSGFKARELGFASVPLDFVSFILLSLMLVFLD